MLWAIFLSFAVLWIWREWCPMYKITEQSSLSKFPASIGLRSICPSYHSNISPNLGLEDLKQKYDLILRQFHLSETQDSGVSCLENLSNLYAEAWEEIQFKLVLVAVGLRPRGPEKTTSARSKAIDGSKIGTGENKNKGADIVWLFATCAL